MMGLPHSFVHRFAIRAGQEQAAHTWGGRELPAQDTVQDGIVSLVDAPEGEAATTTQRTSGQQRPIDVAGRPSDEAMTTEHAR